MFKTKEAATILVHFLFTILFALLSACGGSDKNSSGSVEEPDPLFRSTWKVPADSKTITLPLVENYNYNFTVDWGDGSPISEITAHDDDDKTHTYEAEGDYNLVIEGTLEAWSFNNTGDKDKILSVESFGDLGYKNLSGAFHGSTNLGDFKGGVTSAVTDMSSMFEGATDANPDVSGWDVSSVTDMTNLFNNSGLSTANYDAFLINLADNNALAENVTLGATGIYYYSDDAKTARNTLESDRGWTITDGGDAALFRSTWKISADGETITLPLVENYNYNFTVDWGDGSPISEITAHDHADKTHTYTTAGDYNLVIEGTLEAWSFNNAGDKDKILSVESFGDLGYKNLSGAFHGCANLSAFKGGFTSNVTNMVGMFYRAFNADPNVSSWDVSNVTNMSEMFRGTIAVDPDVSSWDVSNVTDMSNVFSGATGADPDVSSWDVSNVTNMRGVFSGATGADPDVSIWDVSNVTDMSNVFSGATAADPDVSSWDVSNVTNMSGMFRGAAGADPNVSSWDVSNVTNMSGMFRVATAADPDVSSWDVSSVTDMSSVFSGATGADPNVSSWDVSNVTNMTFMFLNATSANPDVSSWDVSNVIHMISMFDDSALSTANYDALLINLANNNASVENVALGASGIKYSSDAAKTARDTLEGRGWAINDGGDATPPTPP